VRRRLLIALWLILGVAIWNGFFDMYVSRGAREYLQLRAEFDAGVGRVAPDMIEVMGRARRHGVIAASIWSALVTGLGLLTVWAAPRPSGGTDAP